MDLKSDALLLRHLQIQNAVLSRAPLQWTDGPCLDAYHLEMALFDPQWPGCEEQLVRIQLYRDLIVVQ
jgi:hypothetical protein